MYARKIGPNSDAPKPRLTRGARHHGCGNAPPTRIATPGRALRSLAAILAAMCAAATIGGSAAAWAAPSEDDWIALVQTGIAASEYHVTWQEDSYVEGLDEAWHAPNRAQNLRTYFTPEGIVVVPRTEPEPSWELGMFLVRWGRPGELLPIEPATSLTPEENRIELDRGPIVEWYVNDSLGLEQGFTVHERPEDRRPEPSEPSGRAPQPLVLDLAVSGGLKPRLSADGQAVEFLKKDNTLGVRYAKLLVVDARGDELSARIEGLSSGGVTGLRLVIDDGGARYPIVVDPLMTTSSWMTESNQADSEYGRVVATAGDVNGDGYSDVLVGAPHFDNGSNDEGRAFLFLGSPSGLSTTADWTTESNQTTAYLGESLGTAGDVNGDGYSDVIVGAYTFDVGGVNTQEGRVYVFHGSPSGLGATADWIADGDQIAGRFGFSVGTAGDVNGDGYSDVIIGADTYDNPELSEGRAYVFHGSASGLGAAPAWIGEPNVVGAQYGYAVATAGDVNGDGFSDILVGSSAYDNVEINEGRAWLYHGAAAGLSGPPAWSVESNQDEARFGSALGTAGDVNGDGYSDVVVGAYHWDGGETDEGKVFVYYGSASGINTTADWTFESDQDFSDFGLSVGTAGDVNGDGFADLAVGSYHYDNPETREGAVFVFHGSPGGLPSTWDWLADSDQADAWLGFSVATAGDVNGDGYSDLIAGALRYSDGESDEGAAYVYHGAPDGLDPSYKVTLSPAGATRFGDSVDSAGDVNGDGFADIIVGDPLYDGGLIDEGAVFVFHGSQSGVSTVADWVAEGEQSGAELGFSVGSAGDVNGDGYSDVVFSGPRFDYTTDATYTNAGIVFVVHGSSSGLPTPWSIFGNETAWTNQSSSEFGYEVASAGDVNGDGFADIVVGEPFWDEGAIGNAGAARVYHGSASGIPATAAWSLVGNTTADNMGTSVSSAGDVNGDGYSDVIIGQPNAPTGGEAFVIHGGIGGLAASAAWSTACPGATGLTDGFASVVRSAGDLNGDGYSDVVAGGGSIAACDDIFVYHGSSTGLPLTASWTETSSGQQQDFAAGDFNGDGFSDLVQGQPGPRTINVWYGSAAGLSGAGPDWVKAPGMPSQHLELGASVASAGDVDGDGVAEILAGAPGAGNAFLWVPGDSVTPTKVVKPCQLRTGSGDPIDLMGTSDAVDEFRVELTGFSPYGRGDVALEIEAKPFGTPFDGTGTTTTAYVDAGLAGNTFVETVSSLAEATLYHWRARVLYHSASTPLQRYGPWMSIPRNGWEEADLRTGATSGAGAIAADNPGSQVQVETTETGTVRISWGGSCLATDKDFAVYMGTLGDFTSHVPETCSTGGALFYEYPPDPVHTYYLVVPVDTQSATEGSYGADSDGVARAPSTSACYAQVIESACP